MMKQKRWLCGVTALTVCLALVLCGCRKGGEEKPSDSSASGNAGTVTGSEAGTSRTEAVTDGKGSTVTDQKGNPVTRVVTSPSTASTSRKTSASAGNVVINADDLFGDEDETKGSSSQTATGTKATYPSKTASTAVPPASSSTKTTKTTGSSGTKTTPSYDDNKGWSPLLP